MMETSGKKRQIVSPVREHPLIVPDRMIPPLLSGTKTQSSVPINLREFGPSDTKGYEWQFRDRRWRLNDVREDLLIEKFCRFGPIGSRLWVKERFGIPSGGNIGPIHYSERWNREKPDPARTWFAAGRMPRKHSRILLDIQNIRVERIQETGFSDACAEWGIAYTSDRMGVDALKAFVSFWRDYYGNGPFSWEENPWVWVITYKRASLDNSN